jgi:pyruvate dehydrogenase E1 component alpha subunit
MERDTLHRLLRDMLLSRAFEEKAAEEYGKGNIAGFLHLYPGEEAVGAGILNAAGPADYVVSTYREHAHALMRGIPARAVMAELFGRVDGISHGMGGSMHMFDAERRFMGGYAIVGETCPIALGIGYAVAMRGLPEAVICFLGDGAVNQGTFHESLNMAALWHLPILFVCENNHYAIGTEIHRHSAVTEVFKRVAAYDIPAEKVDGMDVLAVHAAAHRVLEQIHRGAGPQFLECVTYRYRGHSRADSGVYRPAAELRAQAARDPITLAIAQTEIRYPGPAELEAGSGPDTIGRLAAFMREAGHIDDAALAAVRAEVAAVVADAAAFAAASAQPTMAAVQAHMTCNIRHEVLV